jgi:hypothetical protein
VTKSLENVRNEMKPTPYLVDGKEHDFSSKRTSKVKYIRYDLLVSSRRQASICDKERRKSKRNVRR